MVGADKFNDLLGKSLLLRHLDAVKHMRNDDLGTLHVGDVVMRVVATMLVLSKIHRVLHLTDIVIQGTRAGQQCIASNGKQHLVAEVGHLDGMLERARSHGGKLSKQRRVGVVQFHQSQGSGQAKQLLEEEDQWQRKHGEQGVERQDAYHFPVDVGRREQGEGDIHDEIGNKQQQRANEIMPPRLVVRQNEDHDHAGHQLHENVLERVGHRHRDQQHRDHLNGKRQAGTEEGHHDHGEHHHRHHQDK